METKFYLLIHVVFLIQPPTR